MPLTSSLLLLPACNPKINLSKRFLRMPHFQKCTWRRKERGLWRLAGGAISIHNM